MTQGERIKKIRKELKLTLEKFGEKLGVGKTAISAIENGKRNLTEQMAKSICREYNVSYDYLTYGDGEMFDLRNVDSAFYAAHNLDSFDRAFIETYIGLSQSEKMEAKSKMIRLFFYRLSRTVKEPGLVPGSFTIYICTYIA